MSVSVTIGGTSVSRVASVSYGQGDESELGTATVEAANTASNRSFGYGEEVIIQRDGTTEFVGVLEEKPSGGGRNLLVEFKARDKRASLHYEEVHRPFYEQDSGQVIRETVENQTRPRNPVDVFLGDDLTDWTSDIDVFQLADIPEQSLYNRGSDLLFLYFKKESTGSYQATLDPIPSNAAGNRSLLWFETRYLFNNAGGYFTGEVELVDDSGVSYVWDLEIPDGNPFQKVRYKAQEATSDGSELSGSNKLQFRFDIQGNLPEPRAGVIDFGRARPFDLVSRDAGVNAPSSKVLDSGREITRRFDQTILEVIQKLSVEDGATSFVDTSDDLHYEPAGDSAAPVSIDYSSTRVTDASFDRDSTDIVNRVRVQGANDLQLTLQSSGSIAFYGVAPRDKPLVVKSIQNEEELRDYGEGFLDENAWNDSAFSFTIADAAYRAVTVGQEIDVSWSPEDIDGTFVVSGKDVKDGGKVELSFTGSEA
jgi:hypothetical protein